jgi:hypothetical protein
VHGRVAAVAQQHGRWARAGAAGGASQAGVHLAACTGSRVRTAGSRALTGRQVSSGWCRRGPAGRAPLERLAPAFFFSAAGAAALPRAVRSRRPALLPSSGSSASGATAPAPVPAAASASASPAPSDSAIAPSRRPKESPEATQPTAACSSAPSMPALPASSTSSARPRTSADAASSGSAAATSMTAARAVGVGQRASSAHIVPLCTSSCTAPGRQPPVAACAPRPQHSVRSPCKIDSHDSAVSTTCRQVWARG